MFEVGFTELLLIFALSLLVLGPQKLPKLAQQVGRWVGRARAMARQFRDQLEEEAHSLETKVSVDPGIDTSLDSKPGAAAGTDPKSQVPTAPGAYTPPMGTVPQPELPPSPSPTPVETEEDFYPPDHHMHPSNRVAAAPTAGPPVDAGDAGAGVRQGELDLTDSPETPKAS